MRSPSMLASLGATAALAALLWLSFTLAPATFTASAIPVSAPASIAITETVHIYLPIVHGPLPAKMRIAAAHIDSSLSHEPDEAILLWNLGQSPQSLAGWRLVTGNQEATFPITAALTLDGGAHLWCAGVAIAFQITFGELPVCEWAENSDPAVLNLEGALRLANQGGFVQLFDPDGELVDALVYGDESADIAGWTGAPAQLYTRGAIREAGQVWRRKRDPLTGAPLDSDRAQDWAGDLADIEWGRQVQRPGWRGWAADDWGIPIEGVAAGAFTVVVGPEGLHAPLRDAFSTATTSIDLSIYTFEHPELAETLAAAAERGVQVRVLLEGGPPGGITGVQKYSVARLAAAGAEIRYMAPLDEAPNGLRSRYSYSHAKYGIIDGRLALVGTDNMNWDSMPVTAGPGDLVGGRRGYYLLADAVPLAAGLSRLFALDWQPDVFMDLFPFTPDHEKYGGPPADFVLPERPIYEVDAAPFATPLTTNGPARFILASAPENATRPDRGLMALIARAGAGDEILSEQLYEHKFWGDSDSNPIADPNPRLEAIIDAGRRGARVRLLLDAHFDDPDDLRSNQATVDYVRAVAAAEGLDMDARIGDPTGGGIHAKLLLLRIGEERWSALGSLNGGEVSHKLNREVLLLLDQAEVHARLNAVFEHDWQRSQ